jgi:prepilin-type processing-associated H-X9-DG protein
MRRSPVRFTIETLMIFVALGAVGSCVGVLHDRARAAGKREWCRNVLSNFALAVLGYENAKGSFPSATLPDSKLPPERRVSWVPLIYPWTDYSQGIRFLFEPECAWDAPENRLPRIEVGGIGEPTRIVTSLSPPEFPIRCPSNHCAVGPGLPEPLHYVGIAGLGTDAPTLPAGHPRAGMFGYNRRTRMADITDGAGTTMLLAETTTANGPWTAGGPSTVRGLDPGRSPYVGNRGQFGGAHPGGAMVAFADGSVRFFRDTIDPKVFEAISTVAGGESLPQGWDR